MYVCGGLPDSPQFNYLSFHLCPLLPFHWLFLPLSLIHTYIKGITSGSFKTRRHTDTHTHIHGLSTTFLFPNNEKQMLCNILQKFTPPSPLHFPPFTLYSLCFAPLFCPSFPPLANVFCYRLSFSALLAVHSPLALLADRLSLYRRFWLISFRFCSIGLQSSSVPHAQRWLINQTSVRSSELLVCVKPHRHFLFLSD